MKTIKLQLSSQSGTQNFNNEGNPNGGSTTMSYKLIVVEDNNNQIGDASFSFSMSMYQLPTGSEYTTVVETLDAKIKAAIEEFNNSLKS